jgi:hypothetical protein
MGSPSTLYTYVYYNDLYQIAKVTFDSSSSGNIYFYQFGAFSSMGNTFKGARFVSDSVSFYISDFTGLLDRGLVLVTLA